MVKSVIDGVETIFISPAYQIKDPDINNEYDQVIVTKHYPGGAMRVGGTLYYTLSDHLGSTSLTTDANGAKVSETRYKPWGEVRYQSGGLLSDRTYTGQRTYSSDFGLMYYNARWVDPQIGRFAQADTIVPGGVQGLDRYAYVNNSPVNFIDPSGHCGVKEGKFDGKFDCTTDDINGAKVKNRLGWFKGFIAAIDNEKWFQNIVGILEAFIDEGIGEEGSWVSWADSVILDSIENGWDLHKTKQENDNPADMAWKSFFEEPDRDEGTKKSKWGAAEGLATKAGTQLAADNGKQMSLREFGFLQIGNVYRGWVKGQNGDEFFADLAGLAADRVIPTACILFCHGLGYMARDAGSSFGAWFTDPKSTVLGKGPVYFVARIVLEK